MTLKIKLLAAALPLAFAASSFAAEEPKKDAAPAPDWSWTAHVDLNSAYYLRGITNTYGPNKWLSSNATLVANNYTNRGDASWSNKAGDAPESRNPAFSWGLDLTHTSGFYVGYWASQLTYSYEAVGQSYDKYKRAGDATIGTVTAKNAGGIAGVDSPFSPQGAALQAGFPTNNQNFYVNNTSIENDIYGGYTGKVGEFGYNIGLTYYYYAPGKYSNAAETKINLSYGEFTGQAQTLLSDTIWGNSGDTYWTLAWAKPLPYDLTLTTTAGYYTYGKEGKFLGSTTPWGACPVDATGNVPVQTLFFVNGCFSPVKSDGLLRNTDAKVLSGGFRHLIFGLSQPIGSTGATWNVQAIISGVNRFNIQQDNKITAGISYAF